jgi:hypothetical protein
MASEKISLPASTAWPIVFAFGLALVFAGPVTAASVSILGAVLSVVAAIGWFRDVLPVEKHVEVEVSAETPALVTSRQRVGRIEEIPEATHISLPLEVYPVSAGIKGGLAGSVVMALLAGVYGILSGHGVWYPMNLLVAGFFPGDATETAAQIGAFRLDRLLLAVPIHLLISLLVGLLYGALLPMLPRHPILLGGFVTPLVWSGLIYFILGVVNPVLALRIDWLWFVLSQVGFGIIAGIVVATQDRMPTPQRLPLIVRAGIETPGIGHKGEGPRL